MRFNRFTGAPHFRGRGPLIGPRVYRRSARRGRTIAPMPYTITRVDTTPNPNALKFVVSPSPGSTPRSYRSAPAPGTDPLAEALFAIPGIANLLIHDGWITVSKSPQAQWPEIRRAVEAQLTAGPTS